MNALHPGEREVEDSDKHCPTCHSDNMWAHGKPCYYCGQPVNNLAGNPSEWNLFLAHSDDPGRIKPHHVGCVSQRLHYLEELLSHVESISQSLTKRVDSPVQQPNQRDRVYPDTFWGRVTKAWNESRG